MLTYTINGKKITTEQPLSDADIDEIAGSLAAPSPEPIIAPPVEVTPGDYILNQAKMGLTDFPALSLGVGRAVVEEASKLSDVWNKIGTGEMFTLDKTGLVKEPMTPTTSFTDQMREAQNFFAKYTGAKPDMQAPDLTTRAIGSGIRLATDPTAVLGIGTKLAPVSLFGFGTAADVTGEIGAQTEKAITGQDTGTGRLLGTFAVIPTAIATQGTLKNVSELSKTYYNKWKEFKKAPEQAEDSFASGAALNLLERAAKAEGIDDINTLIDNFTSISNKIGVTDTPLFVAMSTNPVIRGQAQNLIRTNPSFRADVQNELDKIAMQVDRNADTIFGKPSLEGVDTSKIYNNEGVINQTALNKIGDTKNKIAAIDMQLENLSQKFDVNMTDEKIGTAISNLVEAKKTAVKEDLSPKYNSLSVEAAANKIELPSEGTQMIYDFVKQNNLTDLFGKKTPLDTLITRYFSPKNGQYPTVSFSNIDSLKKEINRIQRMPNLDDTVRYKLATLEDTVNQAREMLPNNFNQRLKDIDKEYYEKMGIPFGAQGVVDIDSKKYAEQVVPVLTKNGSAMKDFLNVAGPDGVEIGRNAIYSELYKKAIRDGQLNPNVVNAYLQTKKDVIAQIPGLETELKTILADEGILKAKKQELDILAREAESEVANNFLVKSGKYGPNYEGLARNLVGDRPLLARVMNDLNNLNPEAKTPVLNAIRRAFIDIARNSPDGAVAFISNKNNKVVVDTLFGNDYRENVMNLATISDAIKNADPGKLADVYQRESDDVLSRIIPGVTYPFATSTYRDRISSNIQKVVRIASKVSDTRIRLATDRKIAELLLDPAGLKKLKNATDRMDVSFKSPLDLKKALKIYADLVPFYLYSAGKENVLFGDAEIQQVSPEEVQIGGFD